MPVNNANNFQEKDSRLVKNYFGSTALNPFESLFAKLIEKSAYYADGKADRETYESFINSEYNKRILYHHLNERRRKIKKDINNNLNYLPVLCQEHKGEQMQNVNILQNDECNLAHNEVEVLFHLLNYKTELCVSQNCQAVICPYAHDLGANFRILYESKKPEIIKLMLKIEDSILVRNKIIHYSQIYTIPTEFSLDNFKVKPCMLGPLCGKDPHLCYNYHDKKERRRPPKLFHINGVICTYAQPEANSDFYPHLCQNVIKLIF